MKTILFIHGFMGNPNGGTFKGLSSFFKNNADFQVISFPFLKLHTDVSSTQAEIEKLIADYNVDILAGTSLGAFYALCCKKAVKKIAVNPCMKPSVEIPLLKDRETGEAIKIEQSVLRDWQELEKYELDSAFKNAAGIFGKDDCTFHFDENHNFSPLFRQIFSDKIVFVEGGHSLEKAALAKGLSELESFIDS